MCWHPSTATLLFPLWACTHRDAAPGSKRQRRRKRPRRRPSTNDDNGRTALNVSRSSDSDVTPRVLRLIESGSSGRGFRWRLEAKE